MLAILKRSLRRRLPPAVVDWAKRRRHAAAVTAAADALRRASNVPDWLDDAMLAELMSAYPARPRPPSVPAAPTPDHERAATILHHLGQAHRLLEVGAGHDMLAWAVALAGRDVTALDLTDPLAAPVVAAGVRGVNGDACRLPFDDDAFDGLWSFNAFEHIHDPPAALEEAWRVVRPGGLIHLNFAPLYHAPLGLHAYREVGVPFCQHLWSEPQLKAVIRTEGFWFLNYWPLAEYRQMWAAARDRLAPVAYVEERDYTGLELIARFPSCFAKRSRDVDEFLVSKIVATFRVVK